MNDFDYRRRISSNVEIGDIPLGGDNPIRIQSMTSVPTLDTEGAAAQCRRIFDAGADYVRLTAQGVREAENIGKIRALLHSEGYTKPLVADIHFNPKAAYAAAAAADKVRINPGNFVDAPRTFKKIEYTDDEYLAEIDKIRHAFVPFLNLCREHHTAVRIGVNHGSLSDRIMSRYGDTPAGMVESAMEYLRICCEEDFKDVVVSIKSSNTSVMVETVRRMANAMEKEGMAFPLHLGVTEAGDGEDGRIKSAVGIGTLLAEGIGDTIRVSLSEDPELEIPVAQKLAGYIAARSNHAPIHGHFCHGYDPLAPAPRATRAIGKIGGTNPPVVLSREAYADCDTPPDFLLREMANIVEADASQPANEIIARLRPDSVLLLSSRHQNPTGELQACIHALTDAGCDTPVVIRLSYPDSDPEDVQIKAGADFGTLALNGVCNGILLEAPNIERQSDTVRFAFSILQAARLRISKTEYISCPSCGRTLYDLQRAVHEIKAATSHLKGLKIGIMGCIVNGPGEMADADYGYVGAAAGKVSLYKGRTCVERNIPQENALARLVELIKEGGDWVDPD